MSGGVRVHHPTQRNCRYTVVEGDRPYPTPYTCPPPTSGGCGTTHLFKTHHLNLDDTGSVTINTVLYERLKARLALDGFTPGDHIAKPPPMIVGAAVDMARPVVASPHNPEK